MEWCKLYASLQHDKDLRRAGEAATLLFVFGMCHLTEEETDGFIADDVLPDFKLTRVTARAAALVHHGLWDRIADGYIVPGWKDKQKDLLTQLERRKRDADRKRRKRKEAGGDPSRDSRATKTSPKTWSRNGNGAGAATIGSDLNAQVNAGPGPQESRGVRGMSADASAECPPPEKSREEHPPDPPAPQGGTRCADHKRPRRGCAACHLPALAPVPDWCGQCSPARRLEHPDTGVDLGPCPRCHPSVRAS